MSVSVNWGQKIIYIPQSFLTHVSGVLYELDIDELRLVLKDLEDSEEGIIFPDTHRHFTEVTLSGVTYARVFEIINGYTVTFEDGQYSVRCVGANHNLADVKNVNQVSLIIGNSAGLIKVSSGSGLDQQEHDTLMRLDAYVKNKKFLVKEGNTWYFVIRNSNDTANLIKKALKDKDGNDVFDIESGDLAQELSSIA